MSNATQLFHSRDLIKYLPDLLDGDDPILKRPEAKEVLRNDPLAESALLAVGRAVNTYRLGRKDRLRPARKVVGSIEVARPILTAVDCLTRQLADVLGDHATYLVQSGLSDRWNTLAESSDYSKDRFLLKLEELNRVSGRLSAQQTTPAYYPAQQSHSQDLANARSLITAMRRMAPSRLLDKVRYYLLLIREETTGDVRSTDWAALAKLNMSSQVAHHIDNQLAAAFAREGFAEKAAGACVERASPDSSKALSAYKRLEIVAGAGKRRRATMYASILGSGSIPDDCYRQLRIDQSQWIKTHQSFPTIIKEITAALPSRLATALRNTVQR